MGAPPLAGSSSSGWMSLGRPTMQPNLEASATQIVEGFTRVGGQMHFQTSARMKPSLDSPSYYLTSKSSPRCRLTAAAPRSHQSQQRPHSFPATEPGRVNLIRYLASLRKTVRTLRLKPAYKVLRKAWTSDDVQATLACADTATPAGVTVTPWTAVRHSTPWKVSALTCIFPDAHTL